MTIRDRITRAVDALIREPVTAMEPKTDAYSELGSMWSNTWTGLGTTGADRITAHVPGAPSVLDKPTLAYLTVGDPLARTIVNAPIDDGFRGGFQVVYNGESDRDADLVKAVTQACERLDLEGKARRAAKQSRAVGGAGLIMISNGGNVTTSEEIRDEQIRSLDRLIVADARDLMITDWLVDEVDAYQYAPMQISAELRAITKLHASHVVLFPGIDTPVRDRQKLFEGWYASVLQAVWETLREFRSSWQSVVAMMQDCSTPVLKLPKLGTVLARGGKSNLDTRLSLMQMYRWVSRVLPLDAGSGQGDAEDLSFVERTFTGVGDLVTEQKVLVAQAADMPITRLFGVSPAGLNATGEYDQLNWLSKVAAWRRSHVTPPITRIVQILARIAGASDWQSFGIEWPQLEVMSTRQQVEIEQIQAGTDEGRIRMGMSEQTILEHRYGGEYRFSPPVLSEMDRATLEAHSEAEEEALNQPHEPPEPPPQEEEEEEEPEEIPEEEPEEDEG